VAITAGNWFGPPSDYAIVNIRPPRPYVRSTNPDRFRPLHDGARTVLLGLARRQDVNRTDRIETVAELGAELRGRLGGFCRRSLPRGGRWSGADLDRALTDDSERLAGGVGQPALRDHR
jgi:hypothetical protein